jgi:hypothetical protein
LNVKVETFQFPDLEKEYGITWEEIRNDLRSWKKRLTWSVALYIPLGKSPEKK